MGVPEKVRVWSTGLVCTQNFPRIAMVWYICFVNVATFIAAVGVGLRLCQGACNRRRAGREVQPSAALCLGEREVQPSSALCLGESWNIAASVATLDSQNAWVIFRSEPLGTAHSHEAHPALLLFSDDLG